MMEFITQTEKAIKRQSLRERPLNDNRHKPLSMGRSLFPDDAVARIYKPTRSVTTSGPARTKGWRLVFDRRTAPFIEPLMGYTGGSDTLPQIELSFPTLASAVRYAERQGLAYVVQTSRKQFGRLGPEKRTARAFSDATLDRLGLTALQESYVHALAGAANQNDPAGPEYWSSPIDVVRDPTLSLQAKRAILMNWAWTEYLIDQATNEGMPENGRPSRLDEVEQALLALERQAEASRDDPFTRKAA